MLARMQAKIDWKGKTDNRKMWGGDIVNRAVEVSKRETFCERERVGDWPQKEQCEDIGWVERGLSLRMPEIDINTGCVLLKKTGERLRGKRLEYLPRCWVKEGQGSAWRSTELQERSEDKLLCNTETRAKIILRVTRGQWSSATNHVTTDEGVRAISLF